MVPSNSLDINAPSLAVIVGCWQQHSLPEFYHSICDYIKSQPQISCVIASGNHVTVDPTCGTFYKNSQRLFEDEQGVDWLRRYWQQRPPGKFTLASEIIDQDWAVDHYIIWEQWQIEYILRHVMPDIQNIWYFGVGWNLGVRRDPIGYGPVCDLMRYQHIRHRNILIEKSLMIKNQNPQGFWHGKKLEPIDDGDLIGWQAVGNDIYYKLDLDWNP